MDGCIEDRIVVALERAINNKRKRDKKVNLVNELDKHEYICESSKKKKRN